MRKTHKTSIRQEIPTESLKIHFRTEFVLSEYALFRCGLLEHAVPTDQRTQRP